MTNFGAYRGSSLRDEDLDVTVTALSNNISRINHLDTSSSVSQTASRDMVELIPRQTSILNRPPITNSLLSSTIPLSRPPSPITHPTNASNELVNLHPAHNRLEQSSSSERLFGSRSTNQNRLRIHTTLGTNDISSSNPFLGDYNCRPSPTQGYQSLLTDRAEDEKDKELGHNWLPFSIVDADGGEYSPQHGVENILEDNDHVYCTKIPRNVNILLRHTIPTLPNAHPSFTLGKVVIKIPVEKYTSPLRDGFVFVLSGPLNPAVLSKFDDYDTTPTLPQVPSNVLAVLYFQLDHKTPVFAYRFRWPIKKATHVMVKFLGSYGMMENIDVQFVGFKGSTEMMRFPSVALR